ncbi:MAG: MBL fold metallo-hydrolase [Flavobacteriaceae bacterium]|nr:MBL fold metallo-hydrolase [Bacteroidia bacterium]NNK70476.1 MBL fold metallo-hydrolase [Flavobacteriaceae bacterium]
MKIRYSLLLLGFILVPAIVSGQNFDDVKIEATQLSENVYMLTGRGGNIGVSVGEDGVFVIDDQFAPLSEKILAAIKTVSDEPLRFLANTHWHGDHTGGNVNMAKAGATIMAHDNVRKRLVETPSRDGSTRAKEAFPVITFNDQLNLHLNGEHVAIFHVDKAHTDGDVMIFFTESNVLHTGDNYFNGRFPYIDLKSGGSVDGYIRAVERALMVIDDETKIIPGHGTVSNKAEYKTFLDMLRTVRDRVAAEIQAGKTEDEVVSNPEITKPYDEQGFGSGFINTERIKRIIFQSLKSE